MLGAAALLCLAGRAPRRLQLAALIGFVALPLAFCEGRVLKRVLVRDRMPESQRFLYALRRASHRCREMRATFPLEHSERFILEVVDGFRVVEDGTGRWPARPPQALGGGAPAGAGAGDDVCVLVARGRHPHSHRVRHWRGPGPDRGGWPPAPAWVLAPESAAHPLF